MIVRNSVDFVFSNPSLVFHPLDTVEGTAILRTRHAFQAKRICVVLDGGVTARWTTEPLDRYEYRKWSDDIISEKYPLSHMSSASFATDEQVVWSSEGGSQVFLPGEYRYAFKLRLRENCPASFEGRFGFVRYLVMLTIDGDLDMDTPNRCCFTVLPSCDLNTIPNILSPFESTQSKTMRTPDMCGHDYMGEVEKEKRILIVKGRVKKTGYVPGEIIKIELEVKNNSPYRAVNGRVRLLQLSTYIAAKIGRCGNTTAPLRSYGRRENIMETSEWTPRIDWTQIDVAPYSEGCVSLSFTVPPTAPSSVFVNNNSRLITLEYALETNIICKGMCNDVINRFPITIGTVPTGQSWITVTDPSNDTHRVSYEKDASYRGNVDMEFGEAFTPKYTTFHGI